MLGDPRSPALRHQGRGVSQKVNAGRKPGEKGEVFEGAAAVAGTARGGTLGGIPAGQDKGFEHHSLFRPHGQPARPA